MNAKLIRRTYIYASNGSREANTHFIPLYYIILVIKLEFEHFVCLILRPSSDLFSGIYYLRIQFLCDFLSTYLTLNLNTVQRIDDSNKLQTL